MPEDIELWQPEFKPGWPDIYPMGLVVGRSSVGTREQDAEEPEGESDDDDGCVVRWLIHVGVGPEVPRLALFGDLTITRSRAFAGITVLMPIAIRDEPDEAPDEFADDVLRRYGDWASSVMYDYAASNLRASLGGSGLPLEVPFGTPEAVVHTSDFHPGGDTPDGSD